MVLTRALRSSIPQHRAILWTQTARKTLLLTDPRKLFSSSASSAIADDDPIHRVDLRVGKIVDVSQHPDAKHLYIEKVDLNVESTESMPNPRTIVSGLAPYMPMESLQNRSVVVVCNMKPTRFRGVLSQGMLLAASKDNKVELLEPAPSSIVGERVQINNTESIKEPDPILKPKQRVFESVAAHLSTDAHGVATYRGHPLKTSAGPVRAATLTDAQIS